MALQARDFHDIVTRGTCDITTTTVARCAVHSELHSPGLFQSRTEYARISSRELVLVSHLTLVTHR
jgi:hypothetical protein